MRRRNIAQWQLTVLTTSIMLCMLAALASCGRTATTAEIGSGAVSTATATPTDTQVPTATATATPFPTEAFNGTPYTSQYGTPPPTPPRPAPTATPTPRPATVVVDIVASGLQFGFSPATLSIKVGTTVIWTNKTGAPHTSTSDSGVWSSPIIAANGGTFSFTFTSRGTFSYHCSIHPYMKGTITVTA